MESTVLQYQYTNGEIQKVQKVVLDRFDQLTPFKPDYDKGSFDALCDLYKDFIMKKYRQIYGKIILFTLPQDMGIPFSNHNEEYGELYSDYVKVAVAFKKNIRLKNGELQFRDLVTKAFYDELKNRNCLYLAQGNRNTISIMPVGRELGFMSKSIPEAKMKVNASFFVMDRLDCVTPYDAVGTGIGLLVKNGGIINPPAFNREAFLVGNDGKSTIKKISIKDIKVVVDGQEYIHRQNCVFLERKEHKFSPKGGVDLVIVGNRIVSLKKGGNTMVPCGGFIVHLWQNDIEINDNKVTYKGLEDIVFGLQVGNSAVVDGIVTKKFVSSFYNFLHFWKPSYPPSMYPLDFKKARAPRIVLAANSEGQPVILWFEGAGKFGYQPGKESCGASLKEVGDICKKLGLLNAVNLDGGGSAQILIEGERVLKLSDRSPEAFEEKERAISYGLFV